MNTLFSIFLAGFAFMVLSILLAKYRPFQYLDRKGLDVDGTPVVFLFLLGFALMIAPSVIGVAIGISKWLE